VILIDANLLLYAHDSASPQHERSRRWFESVMVDEPDVQLGLATVLAFLRLATDARAFSEPLAIDAAVTLVEGWFTRANVTLALPVDGHWRRLASIASEAKARGPLLMDAHLATLALERGGHLATTDHDFARFRGLKVVDPLAV
jgi:toxin-antitoxin system PIN domain toxin